MKKKRGDRRDGIWLKDVDGLHAIMPHLMPKRCDAEVYLQEDLDVTELLRYLEQKNGPDAPYRTKLFHVFVTAVLKTVYHRPLLNRFVAGKRFYQRKELSAAFIVKRQFKDEAEESLLILRADGDTTLEDVSRKILGDSDQIRKAGGNEINVLLDKLAKLPRCLMRLLMCGFRFLDFHGWMPQSIQKGDDNYATVLLSNLGSIQCGAAYHHLNEYGTNSIVITIGKTEKKQVMRDDGTIEIRDVLPIGATVDERIADGFYFARSIRLLERILAHPEELEQPIRIEGSCL